MWKKKPEEEARGGEDEVDERVHRIMDDVVYNSFNEQYKKVKELTHLEQAKCFANPASNAAQAEACSRDAMYPYLQLRKLNTELLGPCHDSFSLTKFKCEEGKKDEVQDCVRKALEVFKTCLEQKKPTMARYHADHIKSFKKIIEMSRQK